LSINLFSTKREKCPSLHLWSDGQHLTNGSFVRDRRLAGTMLRDAQMAALTGCAAASKEAVNGRFGPFLLTCIIYFPNAPNTCAPRLRVVLVALSGNPRAFRISSKYCRAGMGSPPTRAVNEPLVCFLITILSST
jgi:hypothetical protein